MLRVAINLFWAVFLADGLVSMADEVWGGAAWGVARTVIAAVVVLASIVLAGMVVFLARVPKRVVIPLVLFVWWGAAKFFPFGVMDVPDLPWWGGVAQVAMAVVIWLAFRERPGGAGFQPGAGARFSWRNTIFSGASLGLAACVFGMMFLWAFAAAQIESMTGGYVRLRLDGIYLVERQFRQGDREVRLTGMMHVASEEFYEGVLPPADPRVPSVVLLEGVTDDQELLRGLKISYGALARTLRLAAQENSPFSRRIHGGLDHADEEESDGPDAGASWTDESGMDFRHADVDVAAFHPKTITFIVAAMALIESQNVSRIFEAVADPASPLSDPQVQDTVMRDLLFLRNERLTAEIDSSLKSYRRVIVPWGAMHLQGVESWLRARKFQQSRELERKALGFW